MWHIASILNLGAAQLWFSDGMPIHAARGGVNSSSRLIVGGQGFLDVTQICGDSVLLDFNSHSFMATHSESVAFAACASNESSSIPLELALRGHGLFTVVMPGSRKSTHAASGSVAGKLKPLPVVSSYDAAFIDEMISRKVIPYQNIPDAPGKSADELRALGKQLFPFSPYSYQLAICIYDWATASFTRLVFMKIFEYTDLRGNPLDMTSIAQMIWASNFATYTPQNPDFMKSFLMEPSNSLADVRRQLDIVVPELRRLSDVENRVLAAAFQAMPRTSVLAKPQLFSGQVDIFQLGVEHFGIEFLQSPLNAGPIGKPLVMPFANALSSFAAPGKVITTKMVYAFTDSFNDALHYSNGIVIVMNFPDDGSWVWEAANYVTPLSDDAAKIEYDFPPGTSFLVQSADTAIVDVPTGVGNATTKETLTIITLQPHTGKKRARAAIVARRSTAETVASVVAQASAYPATFEKDARLSGRLAHKDTGRRCRCYGVLEKA
ncbi:hypothetical protein EXIGLDRAFT_54381 [Exidia glandulosa HHB12029]|uniref:Uncharacterized protein n=1 Tax=Exidia glandulosa HHB12029 TaxID=1314781 RepID=A0A165IAD3_EXIGL|nr:hypothetical protein EXIGLDRAFT_54381 [Exidia glandulosa HHB12029]